MNLQFSNQTIHISRVRLGSLAIVDCILHYHIDWAKMNINFSLDMALLHMNNFGGF